MRLRFSLRMGLFFVALLAAACYVWLTRPSQVARRFADAVNAEDYAAADRLFRRAGERFLVDWASKRWGFTARCEVRQLTFAQLLSGRRHVDVHSSYFELDATVSRQTDFAATPFGMARGAGEEVSTSRILIDGAPDRAVPRR